MNFPRILIPLLSLLILVFPALLLASKEEDVANHVKTLKTSKDAKAKIKALEEIGHLGSLDRKLGKPAVPEVFKALKDSDSKVRSAAAITIGKIDPENLKEVITVLTGMVKSEKDEKVRLSAALGLSTLGSEAKEALPALREAAAKADKKDKQAYKTVIQAISGTTKK